jgi:Divergent InlB B-repeat domain
VKHLCVVGLLSVIVVAGAVLPNADAAGAAIDTIPVRTSSADEYSPASEGAWLSWAQESHRSDTWPDVFVRRGSEPKLKVNAPRTDGAGGGIDGETLVYYEFRGRHAGDIRKFNLSTHRRSNFPPSVSTRWDEFHPTISGYWVLFTRYISSTKTTKVILFNRQTGALRLLGSEKGANRRVYSGQVNGDFAVWGRVRPSGQDVFLYQISTKMNTTIPRHVFAQYNPAVAEDGTVYYARSGFECGESVALVRYPIGGPATALHSFPPGIDVGYGYVDEQTNGTLHWLFGQFKCRNYRWDVYKVIDSHTVSVTRAGTGTGTVTSNPAGIDCGTTCHASFHGGTTVTLTATPDPSSVLSSWSDPSCGTNTTCAIDDLEGDVSLTATFNPFP